MDNCNFDQCMVDYNKNYDSLTPSKSPFALEHILKHEVVYLQLINNTTSV